MDGPVSRLGRYYDSIAPTLLYDAKVRSISSKKGMVILLDPCAPPAQLGACKTTDRSDCFDSIVGVIVRTIDLLDYGF